MLINQLHEWIEQQGLRKQKVAELLDITPVYLSYILSGSRYPGGMLEDKIRKLIQQNSELKPVS